MHGKLTLDAGVVSGRIPYGALIDAAANASNGGLEIGLDAATVTIGREGDRRAELVLDLSMARTDMERLLYLLAEKLELPAFNEREWRRIAECCKAHPVGGDLADRIAEAYGWPS